MPTSTEYENRLLGPYGAVMPCAPPGTAPELFAIPGSHDWYDGLVNFTNIFCRQRPIGGWSTSQSRSYFALRLPRGWWLWGIDLQFGDFLDEPELAYFRDAAEHMAGGDRIVLCMAKEVESGRRSTEVCSNRDLAHLEREVVAPAGGRIVLYLKSGRHHYARYEAAGREAHLVTAGGGGAFLHPTHSLPESVEPPGDDGAGPYRRAAVYPSVPQSRSLRKRVWLLPAYHLPLAGVLGAIQVLLVLMLTLHLDDRHRHVGVTDLRLALWQTPSAFLLVLFVVASFGAMIRLARRPGGPSAADRAGPLRPADRRPGDRHRRRFRADVGLGGCPVAGRLPGRVWVLGGVGGVLGVSGYLWATNCLGYHANEAFAALQHMDQKNFLRLHIDRSGALTVYPIGIDRVVRHWRFHSEGAPHEPWLTPEDGRLEGHLIEAPFELRSPENDPVPPPGTGDARGA